jgi:proline iminopeptidase
MKKVIIIVFSILFVMNCSSNKDEIKLWPEIEPYHTGYLKVSELHEIFYELCGNPSGKPVFILHGGPGGSCSPYMRRFFNPDKFLIVLHDQRGAGKSKPYAEIRENTTQYLVEDIDRLRTHLNLGKIILFGGSWGSTLALAYGETSPQNVNGMILRGIFTATKGEIDHFYHGGVSKFFPEVYDKFISSFQYPKGQTIPHYLFELIQNSDSTKQLKYCRIWAEYEIKLSRLDISDNELEQTLNDSNPLAFALLENYYMANNCFLQEGQLINNSNNLNDIPIIMINGRYDMLCPPITAYNLHIKLPKSKLIIAESSGHWMREIPIEKELLKAMQEFE